MILYSATWRLGNVNEKKQHPPVDKRKINKNVSILQDPLMQLMLESECLQEELYSF